MITDDNVQPPAAFKDEDLVYVDPDTKEVVGLVEWSRSGNPRSRPIPNGGQEEEMDTGQERSEKAPKVKPKKRGSWRKVYPFGTYKSMKRVYQLEGKPKKSEAIKTLDEILPKALEQAFWE
jgi:hypothetical protein